MWFQFPSNGKDFPNGTPLPPLSRGFPFGFNSLQTGRTFRTIPKRWTSRKLPSFNSLQTGRTFRTKTSEQLWERLAIQSFNSLQTGRTFRTKHHIDASKNTILFQFPSNGKDFPNYHTKGQKWKPIFVSIPFKREGLSERCFVVRTQRCIASFNSLQTGRTFRTKNNRNSRIYRTFVSIPFKREGLSERFFELQSGFFSKCLVSIPFKREGLSERACLNHSHDY